MFEILAVKLVLLLAWHGGADLDLDIPIAIPHPTHGFGGFEIGDGNAKGSAGGTSATARAIDDRSAATKSSIHQGFVTSGLQLFGSKSLVPGQSPRQIGTADFRPDVTQRVIIALRRSV
jgi:hypothetical protein